MTLEWWGLLVAGLTWAFVGVGEYMLWRRRRRRRRVETVLAAIRRAGRVTYEPDEGA